MNSLFSTKYQPVKVSTHIITGGNAEVEAIALRREGYSAYTQLEGGIVSLTTNAPVVVINLNGPTINGR